MLEVTIMEGPTLVKRITVAKRNNYIDCHVMEFVAHNGNFRLTCSTERVDNISERQYLSSKFGIDT